MSQAGVPPTHSLPQEGEVRPEISEKKHNAGNPKSTMAPDINRC